MKKYRNLALLLFFGVMISIVCFHSSMNLKERVAAPSEMWGRDMDLGITDYKKTPGMITKGGNTIVMYADEKGFQRVEIDKNGTILDKKSISINGYVPERLVKYQLRADKLFWTENYDLFYTDLSSASLTKKKLVSDVYDFQTLGKEKEIGIATASKTAISLYNLSEEGVAEAVSETPSADVTIIDSVRDSEGAVYIASGARISPSEYELRFLSYDSAAGKLIERIEPVIIENFTSTREGSNSMNNLEIGLDSKYAYVFYEIGKSSSQGMVAKTFMGRISKDSVASEKVNFERFIPDGSSNNKDTYISSLKCLENESDKLSIIFTTPIRTSISREGSELVYMVLEDGKAAYKSIASNTGQWNSLVSIGKADEQFSAIFLQTVGGTRYIVNFTSSGEAYKANLNRTTMNDIKLSVMDTIGAYVFSFFSIFINLITVSFILLWPITVDFFEWKYFFNNPSMTFRIGAMAETFLMYFSLKRIYLNPESVAYMPDILQQWFSPLLALIATAALAYFIVCLYRKSKTDLHSFPELGLFVLIHNIFIYFLYTAYIARF